MAVEFRILGDVEVHIDGQAVDVGHARQQCVLVTLLAEVNQPVPIEVLLDRAWAGQAPQRGRATLHSYVSRLRRLLVPAADARIVRRPGGYVLTVDPMAVDLYRFGSLVEQARTVGDDERAGDLLGQALGLWRGEAFAALDTPWLNALRETFTRQRNAAELDRYDVALRRGEHARLLDELHVAVKRDPWDERVAGQLMLALYRSGQQAKAMAFYQQLRLRLAEELGTDPSPPLQRLYRQILTADPAVAPPITPTPAAAEGTVDGGGQAVKLLERQAQLRDLHAALERARQGRGTTVLVSGEAGIGKTWLLRAFAARAGQAARVLLGSCEDLLTPRTLGPFRDMARDAGGALARVGGDDRDGLIDALLEEMGFAQRPAVVIVEDAHWADDASLDVIRYLARRVDRLPAMLVVSYRDEDLPADHPFRRIIGSLAGPSVLRLELEGLSEGTVARLAAEVGLNPGPVVAAVGGNPFYLTEVLAAPSTAVPPSVHHAVLARFWSLPEGCRSALERLAVVPTEAEPWLVAALLDDPLALDPAERRGMAVVMGGHVRFRHELARRVVEQSLPATRRADHHRRALAALVEAGAEPSRLVHHAVGAADEQAVARYAAAAAAEASHAEGHREAAAFARLALERGAGPDRLRAARLHGIAARALHALNRFGEAAEHADRAVALWDEAGSAPLELGEALLISARMSTHLADPATARAKALRALGILEPLGPSPTLALCYGTLGAQAAVQARFQEAAAWSDRAVELARRLGSQEAVARGLCYRGVARVSLGEEEPGFADLRQAVAITERLDHGDYLTVSAHNLAVVLIRSGLALQAKPYLDLGERVAGEHGLDAHRFLIEAQQCHLLLLGGEWDQAERRLRRLLDHAPDPGAGLVNPLAFLGRILARRGDPQAAALVERAWALAAATQEDQKMAVAAGARIELAWLQGQDGRVRVLGAELLEVAVRAHHAYLRGEVLRYLRRAGARVQPFPACPAPFAAGIGGDWAAAAALWGRTGNPYEQALELTESPEATVALEGLRTLDHLGAVAAARVVRRRLRQGGLRGLPRGPRASTRANPARLTDRQLDVLALLVEGHSNAEIAARLYRSTRTVENHVAALLTRLGVGSRGEVAAAAAGRGLLPAPAANPGSTARRTAQPMPCPAAAATPC
ncbi:MAG TPA: BTAD domain-containing putative transcriptional regulator [Actinomycetes bacterium]|nr:BTAD domain-containing putative transcriptional regulator [Actinomycetes bacterium]